MKKVVVLIISIFIVLSFISPAFSLDTKYDGNITYHQTFIRDAIVRAKAKGMVVQSQDGKRSAIVPKAQKEEKVVEQTLRDK